ncbi:hypothetical protein JCM30237_08950 [Halolamina litorea]|uniref:DUF7968 domain-containing protein n=1 Tax=Halolamina litorea TaxID=1515593 RepID=A0ABD6BRP8_9EURY|nr:hypothetical protein [Halolamina litorea]
MTDDEATRVVLSYTPAESRVGDELRTERFRGYLRRAHAGAVAVGDQWAEFVSRGCGSTRDVTLRVESVEGGDEVGERTGFAFEMRS